MHLAADSEHSFPASCTQDPGVKIPTPADLTANLTGNATANATISEGAKIAPATTVKRIMVPRTKTAKVSAADVSSD